MWSRLVSFKTATISWTNCNSTHTLTLFQHTPPPPSCMADSSWRSSLQYVTVNWLCYLKTGRRGLTFIIPTLTTTGPTPQWLTLSGRVLLYPKGTRVPRMCINRFISRPNTHILRKQKLIFVSILCCSVDIRSLRFMETYSLRYNRPSQVFLAVLLIRPIRLELCEVIMYRRAPEVLKGLFYLIAPDNKVLFKFSFVQKM